MNCPKCGLPAEQETVDIGVGNMPIGPYYCFDCQWVDTDDDSLDQTNPSSKDKPSSQE